MSPSKCQCNGPGNCPLMKRPMSQTRFTECSTKPEFFAMFLQEATSGKERPWDVSQRSRGFGDTLAKLFNTAGIKATESCGCDRRQAWLNRFLPYRSRKPVDVNSG